MPFSSDIDTRLTASPTNDACAAKLWHYPIQNVSSLSPAAAPGIAVGTSGEVRVYGSVGGKMMHVLLGF